MTTLLRKPLAALAALSLIGVVAAGCGGDDAGDDTKKDASSSTDDGSDDGGLPKFCDVITAEQISEATGATMTTEVGPFDACEFSQDDPRALSGSLGTTEVDTGNGGFEAYRSGAGATLDDATTKDLAGLGDGAFMSVGTFAGGENLQAAGGVLVGGTVYTVNLVQGAGMSEDELVGIGEALIKLMLDSA